MGGLISYQDPSRREDIRGANRKVKIKLKFSVSRANLPMFYRKILSKKGG